MRAAGSAPLRQLPAGCLPKGKGALGITILLQQQGLAENQLTVVRVALQQAIEAFHQAVAGFLVGIGGGQRQEVEMGVPLPSRTFSIYIMESS